MASNKRREFEMASTRKRVIEAGLATAANVDQVISELSLEKFKELRCSHSELSRLDFLPEKSLKSKVPLDKIVSKLAAFGIPGLVFVVVMATTGLTGAAAITATLALLGGPAGMLVGLVSLGVLGLLSKGLAEHGFSAIFNGVVCELVKQGKTEEEILRAVSGYPISQGLKDKLAKETKRFFAGRNASES